jgi:ribosomal protein L1
MKIRVKEAAIKVSVAKESMPDEKILENILAIYRGIVNALPVKKDNVRKVMIKLTMSKPIQVEIN